MPPTPQHCPTQRELDDLELLLDGAYAPQDSFGGPITLELPTELADAAEVELVDPEGLPLAIWRAGELEPLGTPAHGPFRRLHLSPAQARERYAGAVVVPVAGPLSEGDLEEIRAGWSRLGSTTQGSTTEGWSRLGSTTQGSTTGGSTGGVVLLALCGTGTPQGVTGVGLVRATLAARALLEAQGVPAAVVAVPLPSHGDPATDHELGQRVAGNYATGPVLALPDAEGDLPEEIADVVAHDQPGEPGVVVFFTGLSGSGKSTLARALHDLILEQGRRTVTSLDGDVVRRNLSAGLTFSREDRETNIRRIGWVAAQIAHHHGVAICSPIAPFDATRKQVRQLVTEAGGEFVLVHVATPLEECERRDRKGLYAKARAGEIPEFTGISSPYEEPDDASVVVDTTGRSIEECLAEVVAVLPWAAA